MEKQQDVAYQTGTRDRLLISPKHSHIQLFFVFSCVF